MDGLAGQLAAQGAVDELMLTHPVEPGESAGHHLDLQVVATTGEILHLHGGIGKRAADGVLDLLRLHHGGDDNGDDVKLESKDDHPPVDDPGAV